MNQVERLFTDKYVFSNFNLIEKKLCTKNFETLYKKWDLSHTDCILNPDVGIYLIPLRERIAYAPHAIFWRTNFILCLNVLYIMMKDNFLLNLIFDVDIACLSLLNYFSR